MRTYVPVGLRTLPCSGCGKAFQASRSDAKWCEDCRWAKTHAHNGRPRPERVAPPERPKSCANCGIVYIVKRNRKSPLCYACRKPSTHDTCPECGLTKSRVAARCKSCEGKARSAAMRGELNPSWKGGTTLHHAGYRAVRTNREGRANGYELEHRLVWEAAHGPIGPDVVIHHINGDKLDNRLENLMAMSHSDHRSLHDVGDQRRSHHLQERDAEIAALKARLAELEGQ